MNIFNLEDIVIYGTPMNPHDNYGIIVEIYETKSSFNTDKVGAKSYMIRPFDSRISDFLVEEKDIKKAYSKYYERNS